MPTVSKTSRRNATLSISGVESYFGRLRLRLRNRHERHYRDNYFHLWADLLLVGILVALAVSIVSLSVWKPEADFTIEGTVPTSRILSGQSQEFIFHYANNEGRPIQAVTLALTLPKNFIIEAASPSEHFDRGTATFELGDLDRNAKGEVVIAGMVRGEPGERNSIGANVLYSVSGLKKQELGSLIYEIEGSVLEVESNFPDRSYTSVGFDGQVTVKNNGRSDMQNVEVVFPRDHWTIEVDNPAFSEAERRLSIDNIKAGESVTTNFFATPTDNGKFSWAISVGLNIDAIFVKQATMERTVEVSGPALDISARNFQTALGSVSPVLTSTLDFVNASTGDISNILFSVTNIRDSYAVQNISVDSADATVDGNRISYTPVLKAGEKKSIALKVALSRVSTVLNDAVGLRIMVAYDFAGQHYEYPVVAPRVRVSSNFSFESGGYYYGPQGDQLGVGPLPPKVDIPTTYWIIWQINNLGNDLDGVELTADLPATVVWADQKSVSSGELSYSPMSRRVLWKPGVVSKSGGNYRASFAISIIPRTVDIGSVPTLVSGIRLIARDVFSGQILTKEAPAITTAIESDRRSSGKGKVEPLE